MSRRVPAWQSGPGLAWLVSVGSLGLGVLWHGSHGMAWLGAVLRLGVAGQLGHGVAGRGRARQVLAGYGPSGHGPSGYGRLGKAVRSGMTWSGLARRGSFGSAWFIEAGQVAVGPAGLGVGWARLVMAWQSGRGSSSVRTVGARLGVVRQAWEKGA